MATKRKTEYVVTVRQPGEVETEMHFLLHCKTFDNIRNIYFNKFNSLVPDFKELSELSKFTILLGEGDRANLEGRGKSPYPTAHCGPVWVSSFLSFCSFWLAHHSYTHYGYKNIDLHVLFYSYVFCEKYLFYLILINFHSTVICVCIS